MKKVKKQKFTSKVIKLRGDEKDYSEHLRRQMKLELITKMLRSPQDWIARLALEAPDKKPEDIYKALKEQRVKLFEAGSKYTEKQRNKLKIPINPSYSYRFEYVPAQLLPQLSHLHLGYLGYRISPFQRFDILSGVALPNSFVNYHVVAAEDSDTEVENDWPYFLTESKVQFQVQIHDYPPPLGGGYGSAGMAGVDDDIVTLGVLVWDFPPPPDKAERLEFEGRMKLSSGCNIDCDGKVQLNCVHCGQTRASSAPRASEYYMQPSTLIWDNTASLSEETYYFSGSFAVEAGVASRLYIGCRAALSAFDGIAETVDANFEVRAQAGDDWFDTVPGVKYTYYWYPGRWW